LFRPTAVEADLSKSADVGALVKQAEQTKSLRRIEPVTNATLQDAPRYRWVALSNTTLGSFIASVNSNIIVYRIGGDLCWHWRPAARPGETNRSPSFPNRMWRRRDTMTDVNTVS
jgi:hypothetical protein